MITLHIYHQRCAPTPHFVLHAIFQPDDAFQILPFHVLEFFLYEFSIALGFASSQVQWEFFILPVSKS
jgi:hypothetical protein